MKNQELIRKILTMDLTKDRLYTPMICLRSARHLSGNNLETGEYEKRNINEEVFGNLLYHPYQFSGLACYLIFLEMVGTIFKPKENKNAIHKALTNFGGDISEEEISAIRALRNSLAHNFGLAIKSNTKNEDLTHKFELHFDTQSDEIITLPKEKWNGCFSDKQEETSTIVNEKNLIQLIENIYQKLLDMNEKGELELAISEEELNTRFSIIS